MGGSYLPENTPQSLAVLSAFISSVNIAGMNARFSPKGNFKELVSFIYFF